MRRILTLVLALTVVASVAALAQGRRISSFPYTQNFSFVPANVTSYDFPTTDTVGGEFKRDYRTARWYTGTNLTNHGLNNNNGNGGAIRLQSTGTTGPAGFVWHGDFTNLKAGTLTIDWVKVTNGTPGATNQRYNDLRIAVSSGPDTNFYDVQGVSWPRFYNTGTPESGRLTVSLPESLDESNNARVRIYSVNIGGSGNHPRVTVDNLAITAGDCSTPGIATINGASSPTTSRIRLNVTPAQYTDSIIVLARAGVPISRRPADYTRYPVGYTFPTGEVVAYFGPATNLIEMSGFATGTLYYFNVYDAISCSGAIVYAAAATTTFSTLSCTGRPDNLTNVRDVIRTQTSLTIGLTEGNRTDSILVVRRLRTAPTFTPVTGVRYNTGQMLNASEVVGYFGPLAPTVTMSNLQADSLYWYDVYGFQSCNATYSAAAGRDSARTLCLAVIGNVTDARFLFGTKNTVGLDVTAATDVYDVVIFSMGPDTLRARPTSGVLVRVGQVIGDDTVRYVGPVRRPVIDGLTHETTYRFYVIGINACSYAYSASGDTVSGSTIADCVTGVVDTTENIRVLSNVAGSLRLGWNRTAGADRYLVVARIDSTPTVPPVDYRFYQKGDSLGKATVLARVTDTTATITGIPMNTALFVKVYAISDCEMTYAAGSRVFPIATAGTDTSRRFPILAGQMDTLRFNGAVIEFHRPAQADGSVLIVRRRGHPGSLGLPLQRNDDTVVNAVSYDRWWQLSNNGLGALLVRLRFDVAGVPGVTDWSDIELIRRPAGGLWTDIRTDTLYIDSTAYWLDSKVQTFLGEYGIGAFFERNVLPVKLLSLEGYNAGTRNVLRWSTATEQNSAGFRVSRAGSDGRFTFVADHTTDASLAGAVTSTSVREYRLTDADAALRAGERYRYRLEQIDLDGSVELLGEVAIDMASFSSTVRSTVTPNPVFGASATVRFASVDGAALDVSLVDARGTLVRTLGSEPSAVGALRTMEVDLSGLSAGAYFVRIVSGDHREMIPLVVVR